MDKYFAVLNRELRDREPPSKLFHYSNPAGALGIIQSRNIWATDIRMVNDQKEFKHAVDLTKDAIERSSGEGSLTKGLSGLDAAFIEAVKFQFNRNYSHRAYVASFSENGDLLSQWRGYCAKGGYSLGFEAESLRKAALLTDSYLRPCIYDLDKNRSIVEGLIRFHNDVFVRFKEGGKFTEKEFAPVMATRLLLALFDIAPIMKDPSFSEEREWRIVSSRLRIMPNILYRATESKIIPYIEIPLHDPVGDLRIREVFCGPGSSSPASVKLLREQLNQMRIPEYRVKASQIPYSPVT